GNFSDPEVFSTQGNTSAEHDAAFALVPMSQVTNTAIATGLWSSPLTWKNGQGPTTGARVYISPGGTLTGNNIFNAQYKTIRVAGTLRFLTNGNTQLKVDTIVVEQQGALKMGTPSQPILPGYTAKLVFTGGAIDRTWDPTAISRGIVADGPVYMNGA